MAGLNVTLLGAFHAADGTGRALAITRKKSRALIGILAVSKERSATRERLAHLLWGDSGDELARSSLRQAIVALKRDLAGLDPFPLVIKDERLGLDETAFRADATDFLRMVRSSNLQDLRRATELYSGPLLEDIEVSDEIFEEWRSREQERFAGLAISALERLWPQETGARQIDAAKRLVALNPLREASHRAVITAYALQGEVALARQQYETCRNLLERELGVLPSPETDQLLAHLLDVAFLRQQIDGHRTPNAVPPSVATRSAKPAVGVLTLTTLGHNPVMQHVGEGLSRDIVLGLTRFAEVGVVPLSPADSASSKADEALSTAGQLNCAYLVSGTVRVSAEGLSLSIELTSVATRMTVWAQRYDLKPDADALETAVESLVNGIVKCVNADMLRERGKSNGVSPDALILFHQGRAEAYRYTAEGLRLGRELLERSIASAPDFSPAHVALSEAIWAMWWNGWNDDGDASLDLSVRTARRAIDIDPNDVASQLQLCETLLCKRLYDDAWRNFSRSEGVRILTPDIYALRAFFWLYWGEPQHSIEQSRHGIRIDPAGTYGNVLGMAQYMAGEWDEAIKSIRNMGCPEIPGATAWLAASLAMNGDTDEAAQTAADYRDLSMAMSQRAGLPSPQFGRAFLEKRNPFRRREDQERFSEGLVRAGIL